MNYQMDEKRTLKKLGIDDFRHITKANVIQLASMMDRMSPEVAQKALEQFPEFSSTLKEMLFDYKELLSKMIYSENDSLKASYMTYNSLIVSLQIELEKNDLSFEQRKYIIEKMEKIANAVDQKDSENKRWLKQMAVIAGVTVLGVAAALGSTLGTNTNLQQLSEESADTANEND